MNSRGRLNLLDQFLLALLVRTKYPERVKVYIRVDSDDIDTMNYIQYYETLEQKHLVNWIIEEKHLYLNQNLNQMVMNNWCDFNWCVNNDTCIMSHEWDLTLDEFITKHNLKHKICYIYMNDDYSDFYSNHGCCFPILSDTTVHSLKFFFPNEIHAHGADGCLFRMFKQLPENRIYYCQDLYIDHYCSYNHKAVSDEINQKVVQMSYKTDLDKYEFDVYTKRLKEALSNGF